MPVIKSAKKKLRQDKKRTARNATLKAKLKTALKKARVLPTDSKIKTAVSITDKAAKVGIIHKNKASRIKSSLAKLVQTKGVTKSKSTSHKKTPTTK